MLKMIKGAIISNADELNEGYEINDGSILANVDADKISKVFNDFLDVQKDPLFLIIEVPTSQDNEEARGEIVESLHKDVYYLDNIPVEHAKQLFEMLGEVFIDDGLSQIGFGNHVTQAEIMTQKYNVVSIYPGKDNIKKYEEIMEKNEINKVEKLKMASDYFSETNPGKSVRVDVNGKSTYDVVKFLVKEAGMYMAERREV